MKLLLIAIALVLLTRAAHADEGQEAKTAYCKFVMEQAMADRDLLRTPNALVGPIQPSTGTPAQMVWGLETSIADQRRAKLTMEAAKTACALYNAATDAQQHVFYALPSIEKDVLRYRLGLIDDATGRLDALLTESMKMVDAQNLTRPAIYALQSAKLRLDMSRTATLTGIASPYVPPLSDVPLRTLIGQKQMADVANQIANNRLEKVSSWNIVISGGAHRSIYPGASIHKPLGAYGEFSLTYNFGRRAINKHIESSVAAYSDWKQNRVDDVVREAVVLESQIQETIRIQEEQLAVLVEHNGQLQKEIDSLVDTDTSTALAYRDQLIADQAVLTVDIKDVQFRLARLHTYLKVNYGE